jgi:hypothetical protein
MDLDLLETFFKLGNFLCVTPPTSNCKKTSESSRRKMWASILIVLYTTGNIYSIMCKNWYRHYSFVIMIIHLFSNGTLYIFNLYVIICFTFRKRDKWNKLILSLQSTAEIIQMDNDETSKRRYYRNLLFCHLVYIAFTSYIIYFWYQQLSLDYFKQHTMRQVENYIQFFYSCFLCTILQMLLNRYRFIHLQLKKFLSQDLLKRVGLAMLFQKKSVDIFNSLLGWPIALMIVHTVFQSLSHLSFLLYNMKGIETLVTILLMLLLTLVGTTALPFHLKIFFSCRSPISF